MERVKRDPTRARSGMRRQGPDDLSHLKKVPALSPYAVYRVDRKLQKKLGTQVVNQLNTLHEQRTYFTHCIVTCQVC